MPLRELARPLLAATVFVVLALPSSAQVVRYSSDFPDALGWTLTNPMSAWWAVDATPASVLGTPSWRSAPNSLNFNNGFCYGGPACASSTWGDATSPPIDISAPTGAASLGFWCLWDTEMFAVCQYDQRFVRISNDGFQSFLVNQCYDDAACGPPGVWHAHTVALQPAWGSIQVRFHFDTQDQLQNGGGGWFVDDLSVTTDCVPPASYCTAKVNSLGCTPQIDSTGFPSTTPPIAFRIRARQVLNNKPGLLLYSQASAVTPFQGGFLCLAAPMTRIMVPSSGGNPPPADCSGQYDYDFNDRIRSGVDPGLVPGEDVYAQYWSRDPQDPFGSGLSNALFFVICL